MSGEFVQRGEYAVASFQERKNIALEYGADEVLELPFEYATQAAHIFAKGAVITAAKAGADKLFFGSESDDPKRLLAIANAIKDNEDKYNKVLKEFLKLGYSFPKAAAQSLSKLIGSPITLPNDILGLEYCKTIVYENLDIVPYTLKRTVNFHSEVPNQEFASASYIRKSLYEGKDISKYTPMKLSRKSEGLKMNIQSFKK